MEEIIEYKPYDNWKVHKILKKEGKSFFCFNDVLLELNSEEYVPKAGLLFEEILQNNSKDKKVLDLGCGYLGIVGMIALHYGAKEVISADIDDNCIQWLQYIIKENKIDNIEAINSNLFSNIDKNQKFDLILSNPPHMPMLKGRLCDSGGSDGKLYIKQILQEAYNYLSENGELNIMMFDFLGIDKSYNSDISISDYAKNLGYKKTEIIYEIDKLIQEGSVTFDCLSYIKQIYPQYYFDDKNPKCKIAIVKFKK